MFRIELKFKKKYLNTIIIIILFEYFIQDWLLVWRLALAGRIGSPVCISVLRGETYGNFPTKNRFVFHFYPLFCSRVFKLAVVVIYVWCRFVFITLTIMILSLWFINTNNCAFSLLINYSKRRFKTRIRLSVLSMYVLTLIT